MRSLTGGPARLGRGLTRGLRQNRPCIDKALRVRKPGGDSLVARQLRVALGRIAASQMNGFHQ